MKSDWFFMSAAGVALILFVVHELGRHAKSPVVESVEPANMGIQQRQAAVFMFSTPVQPDVNASSKAPAWDDGQGNG